MGFIKFENVSYAYNSGAAETPAVVDFSFEVNEGEFVALVGHNGSGKSTVAKLVNGLLLPDEGAVYVDGMSTAERSNLFEIRKRVGVVFQNPDNQMIATIIEDDVAFGPENLGLPPAEISARVGWALECVGMGEHRKGTPFRLSGGQKQRVAIAGVLAIKPRVLVLDESTSMLDPVGRAEVLRVVGSLRKNENMTVIMITHFMEEALLADRIAVLNGGRLVMDGGREIFKRAEELESIGLSAPLVKRVAMKLRKAGVLDDDDILDADALAGALCR
jgi:energy-coupling factor transport system ATP-binding protein